LLQQNEKKATLLKQYNWPSLDEGGKILLVCKLRDQVVTTRGCVDRAVNVASTGELVELEYHRLKEQQSITRLKDSSLTRQARQFALAREV
jgi:hypothetical protein